jgi:hypothetical protein
LQRHFILNLFLNGATELSVLYGVRDHRGVR